MNAITIGPSKIDYDPDNCKKRQREYSRQYRLKNKNNVI